MAFRVPDWQKYSLIALFLLLLIFMVSYSSIIVVKRTRQLKAIDTSGWLEKHLNVSHRFKAALNAIKNQTTTLAPSDVMPQRPPSLSSLLDGAKESVRRSRRRRANTTTTTAARTD